MDDAQLAHLQTLVLMAVGLMSIFFGALLQRSHFCTMGAVSDIVVMSDWTRMRQWVLAIAVAILGFGCMTFAGWITPLKTIYATPSAMWLSAIVGGGLFGWGKAVARMTIALSEMVVEGIKTNIPLHRSGWPWPPDGRCPKRHLLHHWR
ncbi:MAG: hypothetical protein EBR17_04505 [Betaproteobacteria bacterium]|nr:hypothetical protein [Betaproteobacteria bacterium]